MALPFAFPGSRTNRGTAPKMPFAPPSSSNPASFKGAAAAGVRASYFAGQIEQEDQADRTALQTASYNQRQADSQQRKQAMQQRDQERQAKAAEKQRQQELGKEVAASEYQRALLPPVLTATQRQSSEEELAKKQKELRAKAAASIGDTLRTSGAANEMTGIYGFRDPTPEAVKAQERLTALADPANLTDEDLATFRKTAPDAFTEVDRLSSTLKADQEARTQRDAVTAQLARAKAIKAGVPADQLDALPQTAALKADPWKAVAVSGEVERDGAKLAETSAAIEAGKQELSSLDEQLTSLQETAKQGGSPAQAFETAQKLRTLQEQRAAMSEALAAQVDAHNGNVAAMEAKQSALRETVTKPADPETPKPAVSVESAKSAAARSADGSYQTSQLDNLTALADGGEKVHWSPAEPKATPEGRAKKTEAINGSIEAVQKMGAELMAGVQDIQERIVEGVRSGRIPPENAQREQTKALEQYEKAHSEQVTARGEHLNDALQAFADGEIDAGTLNAVYHAAGSPLTGVEAFKEMQAQLAKDAEHVKALQAVILGPDGKGTDNPSLNGTTLGLTAEIADQGAIYQKWLAAGDYPEGMSPGDIASSEGNAQAAEEKANKARKELRSVLGAERAKLSAELTKRGVDVGQQPSLIARAELEAIDKASPGFQALAASRGGWINAVGEKLPFAGGFIEAARILPYAETAWKMEQGDPVSPEELTALTEFVRFSQSKPGFITRVGDGIASLPSFIIELGATAGLANAVKAVGNKGLKEVLLRATTKQGRAKLAEVMARSSADNVVGAWAKNNAKKAFGVKVLSGLAQEAVRLPIASAGRIASKFTTDTALEGVQLTVADEQVAVAMDKDQRSSTLRRVANAVVDSYIENVSERSGFMLGKLGAVAGKIPVVGGLVKGLAAKVSSLTAAAKSKLVSAAMFRATLNANPGASPGAIGKFLKAANIGNVPEEMFEERLGNAARDLWSGLAGDGWKFTMPTADDLASEFVTFLVPGAYGAIKTQQHFSRLDKAIAASDAESTERLDSLLSDPIAHAERLSQTLGTKIEAADITRATDLVGPLAQSDTVRKTDQLQADYLAKSEQALNDGKFDKASEYRQMALEISRNRSKGADYELRKAIAAAAEIDNLHTEAETVRTQAAQITDPAMQAAEMQKADDMELMGDRISAIVKVATGRESVLTEGEKAALAAPGMKPAVVTENGGSIITDEARDEIEQYAPTAARYVKQSETMRREQLSAQAATAPATNPQPTATNENPDPSQKGQGQGQGQQMLAPDPATATPAGGSSPAGSWSITTDAGTVLSLPADQAKTAAEAEKKLIGMLPKGENMRAGTLTKPKATKPAPKPTAQPPAPTTQTKPADVGAAAGKGKDFNAKTWAQSAKDALPAKVKKNQAISDAVNRVIDTIEGELAARGKSFPGGVNFSTQSLGGGMWLNPSTMSLEINPVEIAAQTKGMSDTELADRIGRLGSEEFIHRASVEVLDATEAAARWQRLSKSKAGKKLQADVLRAYNASYEAKGQTAPALTDSNAYYELARMMIQNSDFAKKVTEASFAEPGLKADLLDFLQRISEWLQKHLASLPKADRAMVESDLGKIRAAMKQIEADTTTPATNATTPSTAPATTPANTPAASSNAKAPEAKAPAANNETQQGTEAPGATGALTVVRLNSGDIVHLRESELASNRDVLRAHDAATGKPIKGDKGKVNRANIALTPIDNAAPLSKTSLSNSATSIDNIDSLIANGGGQVGVINNGRKVKFKQFSMTIDGDTAEVVFVEIDTSERGNGLGLAAYESLGKALAAKGIVLQSSKAQYANGRSVWKKLAQKGLATKGAQGVYFFNQQTLSESPEITQARKALADAQERVRISRDAVPGVVTVDMPAIEARDQAQQALNSLLSSNTSIPSSVDIAANEAATSPQNNKPEPTDAQKEAGNYEMGHVTIGGMDITIENPAGSVRSGTDKDGETWQVTMASHYGYIRGTEGKDGDHIDIFIEPGTPEDYKGPVFVVNQNNADGKFDEHKAVMGPSITTEEKARAAYLANYSPGWKGDGTIAGFISVAGFSLWAREKMQTKPANTQSPDKKADTKPVNSQQSNAQTPENTTVADAPKVDTETAKPDPKDAVDEALGKAFEGLFSAPRVSPAIEQADLPKDRRAAMLEAAGVLIDAGITTPQGLAERLEKLAPGGQLRKYSRSFWRLMSGFDSTLDENPDWQAIYDGIDGATEISDATTEDQSNDTTEQSGDSGNSDSPGAKEPTGDGIEQDDLQGVRGGSGTKTGVDSDSTGKPAGRGRRNGKRGTTPGSGGSSEGTADQPGEAGADSGGGISPGGEASNSDVRELARPEDGSPSANFVIEDSFSLPSGPKARIEANLKAIQLLREIEKDERNATAEEKAILAKYSGWGSFKNAFNQTNQSRWEKMQQRLSASGYSQRFTIENSDDYRELAAWRERWGDLYDQLTELLEPDEFRAMSKSILNAHYTDLPIIDSMWKIVERLGFKGGKVLETSAGGGYFVGRQPKQLADKSDWNAVELDEITSRIFSKLYPEARINGEMPNEGRKVNGLGFQQSSIPNSSIDLVIGNFPFDDLGPNEAEKEFGMKMNLHNYFFARSIDKVRPGGLVVAITSASTMDNNLIQRELLVGRAELVAAIRLPNTAFKNSAGTEVTTDIIILRKKDGSRDVGGEAWLHTAPVGTDEVTVKPGDKDQYDYLASVPAGWVPVTESLREPWETWRAGRPRTGEKWKNIIKALKDSGFNARDGIRFIAPIEVNQYFENHPEMVMGKHSLAGTMYSAGEYAVASDGSNLIERIDEAIANLPENVMGENVESELEKYTAIEAQRGDREGSTVMREGKVYQVTKRQLVPVRWDVDILEGIIDSHAIMKGNKALRAEFNAASSEMTAEDLDKYLRKVMAERLTPSAIADIEKKISTEVAKRTEVFSSWVKVRDAARALVNAELDDLSDEKTEELRQKLNETYDAHVAKFNAFGKRGKNPHRFLDDDEDTPLLDSLEDEELVSTDEKGRPVYRYVKRPIFSKAQLSKTVAPESAESIEDAIGISIGYLGRLSIPYMAKLLGTTEAETVAILNQSGLALVNPKTGLYETADMYLSGEVRTKLREAEKANLESGGQYTRNVELLKAAIPENRPIQSISVNMGARWVPGEVYTQFAREVLELPAMSISYQPAANIWRIEDGGSSKSAQRTKQSVVSNESFQTDRVGIGEIIDSILNKRQIAVYDEVGRGNRIFNSEATVEAKAKADQMAEKFNEWIKSSNSTVEVEGEQIRVGVLAERLFNENVAGVTPPNFKGDWVTLPGQSGEIWLKHHRRAVLARMLTLGYGMMAHGVGSGKTYNLIALGMELRRLGKARKVMTLVQNSTIKQFAASHMKAYPQSRILVADEKNFTARKRAKFQARIATGDYDSIILTHSNVALIGHDEQAIRNYMARAFDQLTAALADAEEGSTEQRDIQKAMDKLQEKLDKMLKEATSRAGGLLTWEQLGIDALIVDEAHAFKNAPIVTRMARVKNLPNGDGSAQAIMMQMKVSSVQAATGGKNIFFATGTPITNTMAEAYTMLNFIAPNLLEQRGIRNFDDFATTFGRTVSEPEATWKGEIENVERFAKFINGPELVNLIRSVFDVSLGNESMGIRVPKIKGGKPSAILIEPTEASEIFNDWIIDTAAAFAAIPNKKKTFEQNPWMSAIPIMTMQAGMAQAIDPRLINPNVPDDPESKVNKVVDEVVRIYKQGEKNRTAQVIFSDLSNPFSTMLLRQFNGDPFEEYGSVSSEMEILEGRIMEFQGQKNLPPDAVKELKGLVKRYSDLVSKQFNLFDDIKAKLIAKGIPAEEIAIASSDMDRKKLQASFEKVNSGQIRIIMGSTARLGVGVNIQERLAGCHNISPPRDFKPAMMEQRIGRIERQGNLHRDWADTAFIQTVEKYSKKSFDGKNLEERYNNAVKWLDENDDTTGRDMRIRDLAEAAAAEFDVEVINYGLKLSMDSAVYSMMNAKQGFIEQVLMGENVLDEFDDPASEEAAGFALMAAEAMGNEDLKTKVVLDGELRKIRAVRVGYLREQWNRKNTLENARLSLEHYLRKDTAGIREAGKDFEGAFERVKKEIKTTRGVQVARERGKEAFEALTEEERSEKITELRDAPVYRFGEQEIDMGKSDSKIIEPLNQFLVALHAQAVDQQRTVTQDIFINDAHFVVSSTHAKDFARATIKVSTPHYFPTGDSFYSNVSTYTGNPASSLLANLRGLTAPGTTERYAHSIESHIAQLRQTISELEKRVANEKPFPQEREFVAKATELLAVEARLREADTNPRNHRYYRAVKRVAGEASADAIIGISGESIPTMPQAKWDKIYIRLRISRRGKNTPKTPEGITEFIRKAVMGDVAEAASAVDASDSEGDFIEIGNAENIAIPHPKPPEGMLLDVDKKARGKFRMREKLRSLLNEVDRRLALNESDDQYHYGILSDRKKSLEKRLAEIEASIMSNPDGTPLASAPRLGIEDPDFAAALDELNASIPSPMELRDLYERAGIDWGNSPNNEQLAQMTADTRWASRAGYDEALDRQKHEEWNDEARSIVTYDETGAIRDLVRVANERTGMNAVQTKTAQLLTNKLTSRAILNGDKQAFKDAETLIWAYDIAGSETARGLAARYQPHLTPEERHRELLAKMIFTPDRVTRERIRTAPTEKQKNQRIAEIEAEIERIRSEALATETDMLRRMAAMTADMRAQHQAKVKATKAAAKKQLQALRDELAQTKAEKDKFELLNEANMKRIEEIRAAFADMGVTMEQVLVTKEAVLSIQGTNVVKGVFAKFTERERKAMRHRMDGFSDRQIAKYTGISISGLEALFAKFDAALMAKFEAMAAQGLTVEDFDMVDTAGNRVDIDKLIDKDGNLLSAARPTPSPEEIKARALAMFRAIVPANDARKSGALKRTKGDNPTEAPFGFDLSRPEHAAMLARAINRLDSTGMDMVYEYWINGLLSGPMTHVSNIAGNTGSMLWEYGPQRIVSAITNAVFFRDAAGPSLSEYKSMAKYASHAVGTALRFAKIAWDTEVTLFDAQWLNKPINISGSGDRGQVERFAIGGRKGRIIRMPSRFLGMADEFAKHLVGILEASAQAHRVAKANGLSGDAFDKEVERLIKTPGSPAWISAVDVAHRLTFTDELPGWLKRRQDSLHAKATTTSEVVVKTLLRFIFPFIKTPYNIFKTGLRKTPLGTARMIGKGIAAWRGGRPFFDSYPKAAIATDLAEQVLGWIAAMVLMAAGEGDPDDDQKTFLITGTRSMSDNRGEDQLLSRTRGGEMAILWNGKPIFAYGRYEPFATVIATLVDTGRELKKVRGGQTVGKAAMESVRNVMDQARSKTFLQGFESLMSIIDGRSGKDPVDSVVKFIAQGVVPNLIRQPLRNIDDYARDTRNAPWYYQAIPLGGLAEPLYDLYGRPMEKGGNALSRQFGQAPDKQLPITQQDRAMRAWEARNPMEAEYPTGPTSQSFRFKNPLGKYQSMTPQEAAEYRRKAGQRFMVESAGTVPNPSAPTKEDMHQLSLQKSRSYDKEKKDMFPGGVRPVMPKRPAPTLREIFGRVLRR